MKFAAFERTKQGTGASRRLRNAGKTTGIVYGGTAEPPSHRAGPQRPVARPEEGSLPLSASWKWNWPARSARSCCATCSTTPTSPLVLHVDFQRVDDNTKIHLKVPLHFEGAENSQAVKVEGCTVTPLLHELDVVCMPSQLPEFIKVDLSQLNSKVTLGVQSIKLPQRREGRAARFQQEPRTDLDQAARGGDRRRCGCGPCSAPAKKGKK